MGWKARAERIYEERVVGESLARLAAMLDLKVLPFSEEELKTLARRTRKAFRGAARKRERLDRYIARLAEKHDAQVVASVSVALAEIHNAIGYEEK